MPNFLKTLDGTGRKPFPLQIQFLEWLQPIWDVGPRVKATQLPTGVGKTFIARTVQREVGGAAVFPSNSLLSQASATYPKVNSLRGADHYSCKKHAISCGGVRELKEKPCKDCPYRAARRAALDGEDTFFNPMSLYNLRDFDETLSRVIDEAHSVAGMALLQSGDRFRESKYRLPASTDADDVLTWVTEQRAKAFKVAEMFAAKLMTAQAAAALTDVVKLDTVREGLEEDPHNYAIAIGQDMFRGKMEQVLEVLPVDPPRSVLERMLGQGPLLLMSATLSRYDVRYLLGKEEFDYLDMPSPIPAESRPIYYLPMKEKTNASTSPFAVAEYIKKVLARHPGENAIVHLTYSMSKKVAPFLPKALTNTPQTKEAVITQFKAEGGVFLASGCSEGLDLPDDECRVNIIPILHRQNRGDLVVSKWLAKEGGDKRYDMETLRTTWQQVGRSTRHIKDRSATYIGDQMFPRLVSSNSEDVPKSIIEAIVWNTKR